MGNDNKIALDIPENTDTQEIELAAIREERKKEESSGKKRERSVKASVQLFIKNEIQGLKYKSGSKPYNLEEEFSKTRKNRSPFIPLMLVLCAAVMAALVCGTYYVTKNFPSTIDLSDGLLEEVNVEDLADEITRTTVMYENSLKNIQSVKQAQEDKLDEAKKQYEYELFVIDSMNLSDAKEIKIRRNSAKSEYKKSVEQIKAEMTEKIAAAEKESENYRLRLESYQEQEEKNAGQQEMDEKDVLARLEREKLIRDYENRLANSANELKSLRESSQIEKKNAINTLSKKYTDEIAGLDPQYDDKVAEAIVSSAESIRVSGFDTSRYAEKEEKISDTAFRVAVRGANKKFEDYLYLFEKYRNLPQKHSVPSYINSANKLVTAGVNDILNTAVSSITSLSENLDDEKSEHAVMEVAVAALAQKQGLKAVVIQPFDDKLRIYAVPDVMRRIQKEVVSAFIMLDGKKVEGKLAIKQGKPYFVPDEVDLSEKIANLSIVSIGTDVEVF